MRALVKYSTPALAGLIAIAIACSDATAPDTERLLAPDATAAAKKKPGNPPPPPPEDTPPPGDTPPPDVTPPTAPVVSMTGFGRRHISLAWSSTDDRTGNILYRITVNGAPDPYGPTWDKSRTYYALQPATTYTFIMTARDFAGNVSASSEPFTVTTHARDPADTQPPSAPTNVYAADISSPTEFHVTWTPSTDNSDVEADLFYEVYVNGKLSDIVPGKPFSVNYGVFGQNTVDVFAIDSNGNKSGAGSTTIFF